MVPPEPEHHEATDVKPAVCTCKADATKPRNNITDVIHKWLKDLPVYADDTPENKTKREDMIKDLGDKLKSLEGDRNYGEKAMKEIKKCIEKMPMWYPEAKRDQDLFKNQIADDLFNRLTDVKYEGAGEVNVESTDEFLTDSDIDVTTDKRRSTDSTDEELERQIMDWLEDIPELSSDIKDNKMMAKSLAKKLKKAQKQDLGDEQNQEQMKEVVVDWIDSILKSKGEKLDSKTKTKLSNKLLDKLTSAAKFESQTKKDRKSSIGDQNDYEDQVWEWLDDVVDIPEEDKKTHKKFVKNFAEKLQQLKSENASDEVIEEEIVDFLGALSKKGVAVSSKNKDKFAKKLMNNIKGEIKTRKSFSPDEEEDIQQSILSEISELVDDIPSNISKNKRKEMKDKIVDILAKNINNLSDKNDNINRGIVSILKKEAKMPENEATNLASALINRVKGMPLPNQSKPSVSRQSPKLDNELKQLVSEEVSDVLNDYNISAKKRKEVEKSITEVLADQIVRGTDNKQAKNDIVSILKDANVSEDDALDISNRLLEINKEMSLIYKTQDSKLGIDKSKLSRARSTDRSFVGDISPMEMADYEEKAEREVLDFIEDVTGDDSPKTRKKRKEAAGELFHKLGEIMCDPDETHKDKRIIEELLKYLRNLSIDSDVPREEMARKLANQLQGIGFASTPKKGGYSFYPQRGSMDISSIHIDNADSQRFKKPAQIISKEENKYVKELTELIQSWMDELPIDLSATEDKGFKETMIQDIASDIIDRQKYLQLNPDAKTSDQEELEHLKYEVFRWLNKLLDTDDLSSVMQKTITLMRKIKDVNVPVLVKPTRERTESKSGKELISDSTDSIREEISMWMEDIPRKLYTSTDKNFQKKMINELAEKIQQFRANNKTENIHNEISNWLSKLIKDPDTQVLTKMTEALEARLKQRGFTEASFVVSQDSSQFVGENLIGGIQDWFKNLPLYQKRNSTEKRELESLIPELVKGLKSVSVSSQDTAEADKLYIDEIVKHLKKFPMDAEQKSDTEFLQRTAVQLLHYLKGLQMFTNISDRQDRPPDEYLRANIEDWMNTLPISKLDSTETMQFENDKKEFMDKVKQIRQEEPDNELKLKDVIRSYLLKFPIEEDMKQDLKFINDKVEQLFKNLLAVPIETSLEHGSDKFVNKAVNNWIKLLPLKQGKTVYDIPRNAIDKLASVISNLLVKTDIIHIGDIKHTIEDETEKFLKSVPLDPNVNIDFKSLAEALFKAVKEMSRKRSSAVKPPPVKKTADILFDEIESWCDNLPFKGDTPEEKEKIKKIKQEIASKLIHKIGELNMNPEVFNDEFLYDDMLEDEIDNLLTDLSSEDIKNNLPAIKKGLIEKVNDARHKTQEEVAGQVYKQQLREVISKTLPTQALTVEEQAAFEVLKDNLADAFINLYYVGGDEELKKKYKTKINDEVNKFCNDYLKKHPAEPIDGKKLNHDLYTALKGVPIPKEETVRNEVELVKIKDEVNDWVKDLPLKEQTAAEKMQTNKMVSVLTKKIHDIEKQKELAPDADYDDEMRKEIRKWIKKLLLKIDDAEVNILADKLINNLKNSEKSRRISASTRHSIESDTVDLTPERPKACKPTCTGSCKSQYAVPPSTLSFEDREHLQRIKERGSVSRPRYLPSKDASVSPVPVDAGSQTEIRSWEPCEGGRRLTLQSSGVQTQKPPEQKMLAVSSQAEVAPHVIVREYYWDAFEAAKMQGACGGPCPSQYPTLGFPIGSMTPQMTDRPVSQQPSAFTTQSPGACPQCPHMSPRSSIPGPYEQTPTPQPRRPRKEWDQSCYRREMPGVSSEINPEPGPSRSFRTPKARVTRLGSFDDMEGKRSRSKHDWAKFPEDDEFWADKPRFASDEDEEPVLKERKKEEEKSRCRCRERILTKCAVSKRRGHPSCQSNDDVKRCSKCCGVHCPYPSYLFFKQ